MNSSFKVPLYAKLALIFISIFAFVFTLYIGGNIIEPIVYAAMLGILLNPLVNYLIGKRINRILSISLTVMLATLVLLASLSFIAIRLADFSESYPKLKEKVDNTSHELVRWTSRKFNVRQWEIKAWTNEKK